MKAITLWQPWASLIALGVKSIETRSWPAPAELIGQRIAIHAAKRPSDTEADFRFEPVLHEHGTCFTDLPLGAVVATAVVVECISMVQGHRCPREPHLAVNREGELLRCDGDRATPRQVNVTDQFRYGDFVPGRWAWMLGDIERLDPPLPATGGQRIWNWATTSEARR